MNCINVVGHEAFVINVSWKVYAIVMIFGENFKEFIENSRFEDHLGNYDLELLESLEIRNSRSIDGY